VADIFEQNKHIIPEAKIAADPKGLPFREDLDLSYLSKQEMSNTGGVTHSDATALLDFVQRVNGENWVE
jgi:hypothetical protein